MVDGAVHKTIKVRIPMEQHIQLHATKVLTGRTISSTVTDALEAYLAKMFEDEGLEGIVDEITAPIEDPAEP